MKKPLGREVNICEQCGGPLRAEAGGHYHSKRDIRGYPQYICCGCAGHDSISSVHHDTTPPSLSLTPQKEPDLTPLEQDILGQARKLIQFSINRLWEAVSPDRKDKVYYTVKDFLEGHPELFERVSRNLWRVK